MSFLSRLFGSGSKKNGPRDLDAELERLEAEAESARPGFVGTALNKAGDLALRGDQKDRAVAYYGRAIDAFLEDEQREAARGVANKIIRVRPSAVRTLCTLTWLDLAARHRATALLHLRDYVSAALEAAQQARAATQVYEMAKVSADPEIVDAIADSLDSLDYPNRAKEVRGWASDGSPEAIEDEHELADACLLAAVRSNDRDADLLRDVGDADELGESATADEVAPLDEVVPEDEVAPEAEASSTEVEAEPQEEAEPDEESEPEEEAESEPSEDEPTPEPRKAEAKGTPPKKGAKKKGKGRKKKKKKKR